jgi:hypothetical protein
MPQYSNIVNNRDGSTTTGVLNTESNTVAYTITSATGKVVSFTFPASDDPTSAQNRAEVSAQVRNQGESVLTIGAGISALKSVWTDTNSQAQSADAAATATNTNVPDVPSPPAPVKSTDNPNPTPAPDNTPVENPAPPPIDSNSDPYVNIDSETTTIARQDIVDDGSDPFVSNGATTIPLPQPQKQPVDEFAGLDAAIDQQQQENAIAQSRKTPEQINEENERVAAFSEESRLQSEEISKNLPDPVLGLTAEKSQAQASAGQKDATNANQKKDWRVRLSLAPNAKYLYKGIPKAEAGILAPLQDTDGVIFPYTPAINVTYNAGYDASELIHSNYKIYNYKGSSVDNLQITGDFTAQDSVEADYMLAVIHFLRSVTKMFYGQDQNPNNGVPPPLCYLHGLGAYQFDNHPLVITNFNYSLPNDVDYIRAGSMTNNPGQPTSGQTTGYNTNTASGARLATSGLAPRSPNFQNKSWTINSDATYVPTKMQIAITCIPIVSRNDISNRFSLKKYATGSLLRGSKNNAGGIW